MPPRRVTLLRMLLTLEATTWLVLEADVDIEDLLISGTALHTGMSIMTTAKGPPVLLRSVATVGTAMLASEGPVVLLVHGVALRGPASPAGPVVVTRANAGPGVTLTTGKVGLTIAWVGVAAKGGSMGDRSSTPPSRTFPWRRMAVPAARPAIDCKAKERTAALLRDVFASVGRPPMHTPAHDAPANWVDRGWIGLACSMRSLAAIAGRSAAVEETTWAGSTAFAATTSAASPRLRGTPRAMRPPPPLHALELATVATPELSPTTPMPLGCRSPNGVEFVASSPLGGLLTWGGLLGPRATRMASTRTRPPTPAALPPSLGPPPLRMGARPSNDGADRLAAALLVPAPLSA